MTEITDSGKTNLDRLNWFIVLRIALGLVIIWKDINFIRNISTLEAMIEQTGVNMSSTNSVVLASVIVYVSLLCGLFITVGLFTKTSAIIQIPILIVATFFVNLRNMPDNPFEFILSLIALLLLIVFAIKGSGTFSADEYFRQGAEIDRRSSNEHN